ncbi:o-succinylbenzoate synthase [Arenibacter sp. GZD96]|uniref:o-succinylbenzoate synthase n=1 Tax=Aurantibrevibacter litoralis TaxID=3106030 RepID=UPI002AFF7562|nr:o-succinylbenzoate synthase [Arenibacter sp. GZD-96]MEA1786272.1 o-succinylbenzoate synthase [Arenibacter sp. GZD-96]
MKLRYKKYKLHFKRPSGTSRGILNSKETWFFILEENGRFGIGECGLLRGLSTDDVPDYEDRLKWVCHNIHKEFDDLWHKLRLYPSIQFGLEQAFMSLKSQDSFVLFDSDFVHRGASIPINGLVWMGDLGFMQAQLAQKVVEGFNCIKLKIGAIDFNSEIELLTAARARYSRYQIELRVDANGGFSTHDALEKLQRLAHLDIHSIEQPIKQGQWGAMARLCKESPIPIALDEELIGVYDPAEKEALLQEIKPHYVILKPSLIGGFRGSNEWIALAEKYNIGWWVTSALESNVGLNAIAQWTYTLNNTLPQGLGTGALYVNNVESPLTVTQGALLYDTTKDWNINLILD